jgi:hypothetical protein
MTDIRRYYIPNAIVFITQIVQNRKPIFGMVQNSRELD